MNRHPFDPIAYQARNVIERTFCRLKDFRRIATRYDKLARNFLCAGAGGSRLLELRGPMMVRDVYLPATMKLDVWQKDMRLIREFAKDTGVVTPLFDATAPLYEAAVAAGRGPQDTAAVRTVLEEMTRAGNRAAD